MKTIIYGLLLAVILAVGAVAQTKQVPKETPPDTKTKPRVTQIDDAGFRNIIKPNGKPLVINFWATWCDPCREEFPDLVKIDADYKGRIDLITVSFDFVEDLNTTVPKFLSDMKAEMPAFLLVSKDESAIINSIGSNWSGGLPFTVIFNEKGEVAYFKEGKFKTDVLRAEIEKVLPKN